MPEWICGVFGERDAAGGGCRSCDALLQVFRKANVASPSTGALAANFRLHVKNRLKICFASQA